MNVRPLSFSFPALCLSYLLPLLSANAEDAPALDGVCKSEPMPAGYVAVGEMESPECRRSAPGQRNAWLIDKVRDKIISCQPPDYERGYPPAIGFVVCKRTITSACPFRLDGTPNGFELTKGASCDGPSMTSDCFLYTDDRPVLQHLDPSPGSPPRTWIIEIKRGVQKCRTPLNTQPDEEVGYMLEHETAAPFCIAPNILYLLDNASINYLKYQHGLGGRISPSIFRCGNSSVS